MKKVCIESISDLGKWASVVLLANYEYDNQEENLSAYIRMFVKTLQQIVGPNDNYTFITTKILKQEDLTIFLLKPLNEVTLLDLNYI